jgi:hypothetical protein
MRQTCVGCGLLYFEAQRHLLDTKSVVALTLSCKISTWHGLRHYSTSVLIAAFELMASPDVVPESRIVAQSVGWPLAPFSALFKFIVIWHSAAKGDRGFGSVLKSGSDPLTSFRTTARLHGTSSATKMVDYAISNDPDVATKRRIIKKLKSEFIPASIIRRLNT